MTDKKAQPKLTIGSVYEGCKQISINIIDVLDAKKILI